MRFVAEPDRHLELEAGRHDQVRHRDGEERDLTLFRMIRQHRSSASSTLSSVSVRVAEIAFGNVVDRVTERRPGRTDGTVIVQPARPSARSRVVTRSAR